MADPAYSRVPPDRDTIELALRVAQREAALQEQDYWRGARLPVDMGLRYLTGEENTCARVTTGSGFGTFLDRDESREHLGVG